MSRSSFTYSADRRFIRQVVHAVTPRRLRQMNLVVGALAVLVVYALVAGRPWLGLLAGIGGLVALVSARGAQQPLREAQESLGEQFGSLPPPAQITVTVDDAGLRIASAHGAQDIAWSRVKSIRQTRAVWLVTTVDGAMVPLPAAEIPPDAAALMAERVEIVAPT